MLVDCSLIASNPNLQVHFELFYEGVIQSVQVKIVTFELVFSKFHHTVVGLAVFTMLNGRMTFLSKLLPLPGKF
jgi:hypothetical protein